MTTLRIRPEASATITVSSPVIVTPGATVYTAGFEVSLDGWKADAPAAAYMTVGTGHSGTRYMGLEDMTSPYSGTARRTVTGLIPGRRYTFSAWGRRSGGQATGAIGVTGIGSSVSVALLTTWQSLTYTFTATSSSHELFVTFDGQTFTLASYWDDVALDLLPITTNVVELPISQGKVRLDENYSPYVTANFTVPLTSLELLEQIDPRDPQRVTVNVTEAESGVSRTYDLGLRSRTVDHKAGTIDIELASDEILLHDRKRVATTVDSSARANESSLRSLIDNVLTQVPTLSRNLITAPRGTTATDWTASVGGGTTPAVTTATTAGMNVGGLGIDTFLRAEASSTGTQIDIRNGATQGILTGAGNAVTASGWVRPSSISGVTGRVYAIFYNASNTILKTSTSAAFTLPSGAWTRMHVTDVVPTGTTRVVAVYRALGSVVSGSRLDATGFMVEEAPRLNAFKEKVLAYGTEDANVTARWSAQNAILNPNGINGGGVFTQAGNATLSWSAANGVDGNPYPIITSAAAGQAFLAMPQTVNVKKGDMWTFSAYGNKSNGMTGTQNFILRVYEMDSTRSTVFRQIESTPVALPQSGGTAPYTWARADLTFTIQDPRTQALMVYVSAMATAGSQAFGFDRFMLTEGPLLLDFFSGTTAPAGYVTNWTGQTTPVTNNSVSERRPADGIERLPEVFNWTPGQSLFDFLQPLINASGLRLFCDESRVWRLVDPDLYEVPGYVVMQTGHNAIEGNDSITRNDDTWADAVVVKYTWTGIDGDTQTAYDVAGDPNGKTITREIDREYPGPGAAASILASFAGRGRTQSVTVVGQYAATPGMDVTVNLPGTLTQTGKVRAVELDLGSGINRIETRGLTDALPGSWVLWNPSQTWSQVNPSLKWKDA